MRTSEQSSVGGNGRIGVLLVHGLCGSPREIQFVSNGLSRNGYTVLCPRLAGHGGTEGDLAATTWQDWYESAEKGLEELAATCETVIVGGLSTGAVLALRLAARHKDKVHGLVLYSPALWLSGRRVPWYMPLLRLIDSKRLASLVRFPVPIHVGIKDPRIRSFVTSAAASGGTKAGPSAMPGGAVLERRRLAREVMKELGAITQPVLILHAREDDYAGLDNAAHLQRELAGRVDLVVLEDSYHMVTVDRQRHVVLDRTVAFVSRFDGAVGETARTNPAPRPSVGHAARSAA